MTKSNRFINIFGFLPFSLTEPIFPDFTRKFTLSATVMWVILSKMDDINNNIDPENQVSYGIIF